MNIDLNALKVIEDKQGIAVDDLLTTIASALLFAYLDYRDGKPDENTKSRVDIDPDTGAVDFSEDSKVVDPLGGEVFDTPEFADSAEGHAQAASTD